MLSLRISLTLITMLCTIVRCPDKGWVVSVHVFTIKNTVIWFC